MTEVLWRLFMYLVKICFLLFWLPEILLGNISWQDIKDIWNDPC